MLRTSPVKSSVVPFALKWTTTPGREQHYHYSHGVKTNLSGIARLKCDDELSPEYPWARANYSQSQTPQQPSTDCVIPSVDRQLTSATRWEENHERPHRGDQGGMPELLEGYHAERVRTAWSLKRHRSKTSGKSQEGSGGGNKHILPRQPRRHIGVAREGCREERMTKNIRTAWQ